MECEHNPKKPIHCEQGCGLIIPKDELTVGVTHALASGSLVWWVVEGGKFVTFRALA